MAALATEPDEETLQGLTGEAQQLADMVGWADDIIDKDCRVSDAFMDLQARARARHEVSNDGNVAILHDVLGELMAAILKHDEDLRPSSDSDDDSGVL
jgi:hypothetical protein